MAKKVAQIIEEQVKAWRRRSYEDKVPQVKKLPVITVSREFGARGQLWQCFWEKN